eukprot:1194365-Prorocentrum_minimum.AAC.6
MASRNRRRKSESSDDTESVATVATGSTSPASSSTAFTKTTAPTNKFETGSEPGGRDIERGLGSDGGRECGSVAQIQIYPQVRFQWICLTMVRKRRRARAFWECSVPQARV